MEHLDIFTEDLEYLFCNSKRIFVGSQRARADLNAEKMGEVYRLAERSSRLLGKLDSMYRGLDVAKFDNRVDSAIKGDLEDVREMMAMCRKELEGEVYGPGSEMFRIPAITRVKDVASEVVFDIRRLKKGLYTLTS